MCLWVYLELPKTKNNIGGNNIINNASDDLMKKHLTEVVEMFLKLDEINETCFMSNYRFLSDNIDVNGTTKSIHHFSSINIPLGYDKWFIAAYPDVVNWFQDLSDKEMTLVLGNVDKKNFFDDKHKVKMVFLRKIVDSFTDSHKRLECAL